MKPTILINKIEDLKSIYKAALISNIICQELEISFKTLYRYINDITLMPVDKALKLYLLLGLSLTDLQIDLDVNPYNEHETIYSKLNTKVA